jgi:phosphatidylserine/phosphatidylglycerophosphate/cardiolipin synthase-like enzyme
MKRAFSLTSDSLAYFIGYTLVHAPRVVIVSPWISDVTVRLPITDEVSDRHLRLSKAISALPETEVTLVVQTGESHNDYIDSRLPEWVEVLRVDDLHAKAVVSPEYVYLGSANITRGGLEVNRELCEVIENKYESVEGYLAAELDVELPEST